MESTGCLPPHPTGRADFPHPAVPDSFARGVRKELHDVTSQHHQTEVLAVCVKGPTGRWPVPSPAPPPQVDGQPTPYVPVDRPEYTARIAKSEVVRPTCQMPIQLAHKMRDGLVA